MFKKPLWQTVWTQILIGAVCSGSMLFASILNLSVMLGNYLQQTTSADDIFRCIFFLGAIGVKSIAEFWPFTHSRHSFNFVSTQYFENELMDFDNISHALILT